MSAHREENVDHPDRLNLLLDCLEGVVAETGMPVLVSTHPRTRKRLDALGRSTEGITFHEPLGFLDYNQLQKQSFCVLSDSGTISEESSLLDFPAVTLRDSIERPEALDSGIDPDDRARRDQRRGGGPLRSLRHRPRLARARRLPHQ